MFAVGAAHRLLHLLLVSGATGFVLFDYFVKLDTSRIQRHHVRRLEQLGYTVKLTPGEVA
jgi:hypothetical protein